MTLQYPAVTDLPTYQRLARYRKGNPDYRLEEIYYQFGDVYKRQPLPPPVFCPIRTEEDMVCLLLTTTVSTGCWNIGKK